jgi:translocation and assembly module TamB
LTWPLGQFAAGRHVEGTLHVDPPPGVSLMTRAVPVELIEQGRLPRGPAARLERLIPLPFGGDVTFDAGPKTIRLQPGRVMTQRTYVEFQGETTTGGGGTRIPFFVSSADWQESYRVFAAMRTALGSRTTTIDIGGYGTFDGVLLDRLTRPRIEGTFEAGRMRAWGVEWGSARGRTVIENSYADVTGVTIASGDSTIAADGRFSLGFPRSDGGEELNARVRLVRRPIADLRTAFGIERYPIDGLLSGEFHVFGQYRRPLGYGTLEVTGGRAYGEPFERATAALGLEGAGARLTGIEILKGGGAARGAAYVGWDASYSFDVTATAIPVESVTLAARSPVALSGLIDVTARGSGTFDMPRYSVNGQVRDLFAGDEGIGQVVGEIGIVGNMMTVKADVASRRLAVGVSGQLDLTDALYTDLDFTISDTSLDPYVRLLEPRLSPFTTAVVSGGVHVTGELSNPDALKISARVDKIDLHLFDYGLQNPSPFTIAFDRNSVSINEMLLYGEDTKLRVSGVVGLADERVSMQVVGSANLAVLQGVVPNIRSSGQAQLFAELSGALRDPIVTGRLTAQNGRIRHFDAPGAIENITGTIAFDSRGVTLDGLTAKFGNGPVQFGGRIDKDGYLPGQLSVTINGQNMNVEYPRGLRSTIDTALTLQGTIDAMRLSGDVTVKNALYAQQFPSTILDFFGNTAPVVPSRPGPSLPLTYDAIRILASSSIRVQNTGDVSARIRASADLELRGTYERPVLSGDVEIDRGGEITFLGKRYTVTQGTVYFTNPTRIEPSFDIEAETRIRAPGETYRITASVRGTCCDRLIPDFTSDPALPTADLYALILSDVAPSANPEIRRFQNDVNTQQQLLQELVAQAATGALSAPLTRAIQRTFGVDAFRITPSLADPNQQSSRLEPGARLTLGKRLSARGYLEYSRSLSSSTRDEIIVFTYDQTERLSWILSRNEDQTYAIEFRVRRTY